jgi:mannose/cellobiose epimerase-like protein (N-acyl-D-glucosamine 2-epimerase family)
MRLSRAALRAHLVDQLLPLWARHGLDRGHGGYWSRLGPARVPTADGSKRLLVHARQVYAFSRGSELGASEWARSAAAHGLEFLIRHFWDRRHGGWFTTTTETGEPLDRRKDLYAHAFAIFGLAEHHRITGEAESLARARETWALVRDKLREPKAGGFLEGAGEDWRPVDEPRRQNPHMHLVEALLALHTVAPADGALAEAEELVQLLAARWLDPATGALGELYTSGWDPQPGSSGHIAEPGHGFEWVGLLHRFAELGGDPRALGLADRLYAFARGHGIASDGGVFDQVDRAGRVLDASQRLWPQTERLKAQATLLRARPEPGLRAELEAALERCFERYVDADGGWREHLTPEGRPLTDVQNATSVYHVVAALGEVLRVSD